MRLDVVYGVQAFAKSQSGLRLFFFFSPSIGLPHIIRSGWEHIRQAKMTVLAGTEAILTVALA